MPPVGSLERFVVALRKSGLMDDLHVNRVMRAFDKGRNADRSASALAESLVRCGLLTAWQAGNLLEDKYKGFYLDKYVLVDQRDSSAEFTRYLARHAATGRRLLLKVFNAKSSWWRPDQIQYELEKL